MRILVFGPEEAPRLGVLVGDAVVDVATAARTFGADGLATDPAGFYRQGLDALSPLRSLIGRALEDASRLYACLVQPSDVKLRPCVPYPGKIICVGLNYLRHAEEAGLPKPKTPVLFSKFTNALASHEEHVPLPSSACQYDYEAELVAVIGRRARNVSADEALEHVLGYCNGNDLSARDLQAASSQWLLGKTLDKFMPLGPELVTADEAGDPQAMRVRCWLNGELRQDSSTGDMIFDVATCIAYASTYMTLEPGDVISTGTPEGVIFGRQDKAWLKPGDEVVVQVGDLGRLANRMVAGE